MGRLLTRTAASSQVCLRSELAWSDGAASASPDTALLSLSGKQKKARAVTLEEEAALLKFYQTKMQVRGTGGRGYRLLGALSLPSAAAPREQAVLRASSRTACNQALGHYADADEDVPLAAVLMHVATCQ
jgi:hypothetical protein